jgi:hypothetical protein
VIINASFNIPVIASLEVADEDFDAARAAGMPVSEEGGPVSHTLATWLIKYWCSKDSDYAIYDLIADGEDERDLPELVQINDIDGAV